MLNTDIAQLLSLQTSSTFTILWHENRAKRQLQNPESITNNQNSLSLNLKKLVGEGGIFL